MPDDVGQYLADLPLEQRAELELRLLRARAGKGGGDAIPRRWESGPSPLGLAQQRLWFLDQLEPGSPVYNISRRVRMQGALHLETLRQTLAALVARHESLRTRLVATEEGPRQVVSPSLDLPLLVTDLRALPSEQRESEARRLAVEEARRPFDLARGPLLRTTLVRLADDDHLLLLTIHHVVSDVWSMGVLFRELGALYGAFSRGDPSPLPALPIQYADYTVWQDQRLRGERLERELAWWRNRLRGAPAALDLPTDHPRPPARSGRGGKQSLTLDPRLSEALKALGHREQVTLFTTLLAGFQALLMRYTGQEDIVVGCPIAGRTRAETEGLIGFFVNTLALRTDLSGDPSFRELLGRVREVVLEADAHQEVPFEKLVEELQPERDLGRTPLFQVAFALQNVPRQKRDLPGLTLRSEGADTQTSKFDLMLYTWERGDGIRAALEYSADLFGAETARRLLTHFDTLLRGAVAEPDRRISELPLLSPEEWHRVVVAWNETATAFPREATVGGLFQAQAAATPDAPALAFGAQRLSYRELDRASNRLARYLQARGVGPDVPVGLGLDRSLDLLIGMLGIIKAGGCYVPLDPHYPPERVRFILADAGIGLIVTDSASLDRLSAGAARTVCLDGEAEAIAREDAAPVVSGAAADNLVYAMYTSGSTGVPKAVGVPHRGVVRLVRNTDYFETGPGEVFFQLCNIGFDVSTFELWGALLNGGCLAIAPPGPLSLEEIGRAIREHGVTTLWLTAGLFHPMVDERLDDLRGVRQLLAGGDVLSPPHVARAIGGLPNTRVIDGYGPTEATTFACCHAVEAVIPGAPVPIGRPIGNTTAFVLDRHLRPVPIGVPGELFLGGPGVARGYLGRPGLTAERFLPDPFLAGGGRLYRTGDRARWRADGTLDFLGRLDHQVKVRGFRVEPGEIEVMLAGHPAVRSAVVVSVGEGAGEKRLVAYLLPDGAAPSAAELREYLQQRLPDFMVPSLFIPVEAWPLSASGKLDRRALPSPAPARMLPETAHVPPRTAEEERLAGIWADLLRVERVGVHDNFFALGGHSLLATQLMSRARAAFGVELPLRALFEAPTVAGLAARLETAHGGVASDLPPLTRVARESADAGMIGSPASSMDGPAAPAGAAGAPGTVEERLARIWIALLRIEQVGVNDDFFDLGGHSLLATQLLSRVRAEFGIELPLRGFFDAPTLAGMAGLLGSAGDGASTAETPSPLEPGLVPHRETPS